MGQLVVHGNLKLNTVVPSGTGDNVLTADPTTGDLGQIGAIDTATYIPKTLTSAYILVGNGSNVATGVAVTGDITMSNAGVAGIASGVIVNDDVNASAAIALSKLAATTASRALVSDGSGFVSASAVTATELGYVSGVTSAIQTQLNAKVATSTLTTNGDILYRDGTGTVTRLPVGTNGYVLGVTAGIPTWEAKQPVPNGGTTAQYLAKNSNTDGDVAWVTLTAAKITDVTATAAELNITDGLTATTTELNYSSGVTSGIQTQINSKQATITGAATTVVSSNLTASRAVISDGSGKLDVSTVTSTELAHLSGVTSPLQSQIDAKQNATLTQNAIWVGNASNVPTALPAGTAGQVLTISAGAPTWVTPGSGGTVTSVQVSGGTTGMSFSGGPITTTGTMTMIGTLAVANGGTNITSYAVGDLLQATAATTLSKLASVSAGSYLRSGGVTTASAWSTVKLPDTMSALGLWVANSANTTVNLTAAAGQSVRVNAGGTAWEAYTPGAGSIGGSTGATDNAILRADGTGGVTLQASAVIIQDDGDIDIGTDAGILRVLQAAGSGTNVGIGLYGKGTGNILLGSGLEAAVVVTDGVDEFANTANNTTLGGNVGFNYQSGSKIVHIEGGVAPSGNPASGLFSWASDEPEGRNLKIRTSTGNFAKPILQRKVTVAGGATLRGIGSTPVEIIPAPGANKFIHVSSISVSYNYNLAVYNFGVGSNPTFQFSGGGIVSFLSAAQMNTGADFNIKLHDATGVTTVGGAISPSNTALQLGTQDNGNASTGDGDIDVVVYYWIEDQNT